MRATVSLVGFELEENLSLRYLAAAVEREGFKAELHALGHDADFEAVTEEIIAAAPLVVGISVPFQMRAAELLGIADRLRARGHRGHIVAGGHFATFEYENILRDFPGLDSVVRHEGEETLVELCGLLRDQRDLDAIPGLILRSGARKQSQSPSRLALIEETSSIRVGPKRPTPPLDTLAFPDRRGPPHEVLGVSTAPLVASRGCYADCSFCCIYAYADNAQGPRYRMRSPENVVEEMVRERRERGVRLFIFHDDNFFLPHLPTNLKRYRRFAELLEREQLDDIGMVIKCRPNDVDPELFALLKKLGMIRTYIGIETNSDEGVISLNRRITSEDNARALRILRELDVYHSFNVLIFDPEATLSGVQANLDFLDEFADTPFNFCRAEVYAGTPLKTMLESEARLKGNYLAWGYEMRDARVELLFRIATTAFMARNFNSDGVANLNMGMRFDAEVLRRFYPTAWDPAWQARLTDYSRAVGKDTVEKMRRALAFVREVDVHDVRRVNDFALQLARDISRTDLSFVTEIKRIRREMEARIGSATSNYATHQPPWARESLRLGTSVGLELSTELLPRPASL